MVELQSVVLVPTSTTIVSGILCPFVIVPRLQVMFPPEREQRESDFALSNVVFAGSGSVTTTLVALSGPLLVAVTVYVISPPRETVDGPVFVTETSAEATVQMTVVKTFKLRLLLLSGSAVELATVA